MRRRLLRIAALALVAASFLLGASTAAAQTDGEDIQIVDVDTSALPVVTMAVAVPGSFEGEDLSVDSFAVAENGSEVELKAGRDTDRLDVMLVLDTSGSMKGAPLNQAIASARSFVDQIDPSARVGLVTFSDSPTLQSPLTTSRAAISSRLGSLGATGETALYDGIRLGAQGFDDPDARKVVVLLSDGADTASAATAQDAAATLAGSGAELFSIPLQSSDADFEALKGLTDDVDGRWLPANEPAALQAAYDEVAARLNNRWVLQWNSNRKGPVELAVSVASGGEVAATTTSVNYGDAAAGTAGSDAAATQVIDEAVEAEEVSGSWLDTWGRWIGIGCIAVAVALAALALNNSGTPVRRLAAELGARRPQHGARESIKDARGRVVDATERLMARQGRQGGVDRALERAGMDMRPGEYVSLVAGITFLAVVGLALLQFFLIALIVAVLGVVIGLLYPKLRAERRSAKFLGELDSALTTMAGSLRAGYGLPQALDLVARETEGPISEEFTRVVMETRLGRDVIESLQGVDERIGASDFSWVVKAISIHRELGGDLAEVLDNVAGTIRDRNRLRATVKALAAEGRLSAYILLALPVFVFLWVFFTSEGYYSNLTEEPLGWIMIIGTLISVAIGSFWMSRIVKVKF
jgi:tight adherence protein B